MPYKDPEKQKASVRDRQERKRDELRAIKERTPCADCGEKYPYWVMQFDHRDPSKKKFRVSGRSASFGSKEFMEEIAKCDIVCANCHATRSHTRHPQGNRHAKSDALE